MTKSRQLDSSRFESLTVHLKANGTLWKPRPFVDLPVSWESAYPKIASALRSLNTLQVERIRTELSLIASVSPELSTIFDLNEQLTKWPKLEIEDVVIDPNKNPLRVSGRKWQQIAYFVSVVAARSNGAVKRWLDWCSGKGHLGRALSDVTGLETTFIEKNEKLCGPHHVMADVINTDLSHLFQRDVGAVALHACGNLNATLLESAVQSECLFLAIAPCCYQRINGSKYQPLSRAGKLSGLQLDTHHLRLVSFEEVVLGRGQKKRRARDHAFRLAFDLLAREATGEDRYRPLGQLPTKLFDGSFEKFATRVAEKENIDLPVKWQPAFYERAGAERWETNRALSLVRSLFARSLESWLLLDRILFLEENGWSVEAGTFCDRHQTPRNLAIVAIRR